MPFLVVAVLVMLSLVCVSLGIIKSMCKVLATCIEYPIQNYRTSVCKYLNGTKKQTICPNKYYDICVTII